MIGRILILLLIIVPIAELIILVQLGRAIGFWYTLGILIILGLIGFIMVRKQGFSVLQNIRRDMALGIAPGQSLLNGLMVLLGGILLIIPGLISDLVGLLLLIPMLRRKIVQIITPLLINHFIKNTKIYIKRY